MKLLGLIDDFYKSTMDENKYIALFKIIMIFISSLYTIIDEVSDWIYFAT